MKIEKGFSLQPLSPEEKLAQQDKQLREAAKMYETHFLNEMVKSMRSTVHDEDGLVKANFAQKIFTEQLDQQHVDAWANRGGVGLADMIYKQIKEQYFQTVKRDFSHPGGALPLEPKDGLRMKPIPQDSKTRMQFRLEAPSANSATEVKAPMAGRVQEASRLDDGWNSVKLDHGRGLVSELAFPGQLEPGVLGTELQAGERLGRLANERPVVAWGLDWSQS